VQADDAGAVVSRCVAETRRAWQRREPAIVETHRVNYSHTDPAVVATGMASLARYLELVCADKEGPVFLCDTEIAQLKRRGTSWRVAGDVLVLRNASHASRVVAVPGAVRSELGWSGTGALLIRLSAGEMRLLAAADVR